MPRPKRKRFIESPPKVDGFKPFGVPMGSLEPVILLFEEYEAMRLTDYEGLNQEEAALKMNVSRPTFTRIYERARQNVAKAFVEGKAILIEGGDFHSDDHWYKCTQCQKLNISKQALQGCNYCQAPDLRELN
ncbi:DUF134 domain-containing protein [Carboxylicivirga taeanensis]|uniref:DUF134 domain-containing protein n=1 Tax=Carboxylicivirga taeanensis TaxID=1416875 RepID=UPI003F6DE119